MEYALIHTPHQQRCQGNPYLVVAHELGHVLGLEHNAESHTLMCGPCQPLTAEPDETGFLPLTESDRTRLLELYGES